MYLEREFSSPGDSLVVTTVLSVVPSKATTAKDTENSVRYGKPLAADGVDLDFRIGMSCLSCADF